MCPDDAHHTGPGSGLPPKGMDRPDDSIKNRVPATGLLRAEEAFVEAVNNLPEGVPGISEFENRLAKKKADEDAEEARKIEAEKSNPLRPLTEEEFSALSWEDRAVRAEALLGNQVKAMNSFLLKLGKAFQHSITDLEYKQQDGHKHAVFSKEIVRDLFKRAFGKTLEEAANAPAEAK